MSSDRISKRLGELLLQGWTMLNDSCAYGCPAPLMRNPRDLRKLCVACDRYMTTPEEMAAAEEKDAEKERAAKNEKEAAARSEMVGTEEEEEEEEALGSGAVLARMNLDVLGREFDELGAAGSKRVSAARQPAARPAATKCLAEGGGATRAKLRAVLEARLADAADDLGAVRGDYAHATRIAQFVAVAVAALDCL